MADEQDIDPTQSDDSPVLDSGDELTAAGAHSAETSDAADSEAPVEDPEELAAAEAEVVEHGEEEPVLGAPTSRRPRRKGATDAVAEPEGLEDDAAEAVVATSPLRPKRKTAEVAKKDGPTPKRKSKQARKDDAHPRTGPVTFVQQSVSELRKVVWPTGSTVAAYFLVVLVFVLFVIAFVMALDFGFGWLLLKLLG